MIDPNRVLDDMVSEGLITAEERIDFEEFHIRNGQSFGHRRYLSEKVGSYANNQQMKYALDAYRQKHPAAKDYTAIQEMFV